MPSSIFAKYSPELILGESLPIAIADNKQKISVSFKLSSVFNPSINFSSILIT